LARQACLGEKIPVGRQKRNTVGTERNQEHHHDVLGSKQTAKAVTSYEKII
jgi:hypothetical protein